MADAPGAYISALALLVSIASFVVARAAETRSRTPVLVFVYLSPEQAAAAFEARGLSVSRSGIWELRNVGAAPAHNVIVAQSLGSVAPLRRGINEGWHNPVLLPAIPSGGAELLTWLPEETDFGLGASYTDAYLLYRTTKCGGDVSFVLSGLHLPRWPMLEIVDGQRVVRPAWCADATHAWSKVKANDVVRAWWLPKRWGVCRRLSGWSDPVEKYRKLWLPGTARPGQR